MLQNKREKSLSLRKQSLLSIYTNESKHNLEKTKADRFLKLKAQLEVKQRLFKETAIKNRSLSIST